MNLEVGKTYVSRDGKIKVKIIAVDLPSEFPVVGYRIDNTRWINTYTRHGGRYLNNDSPFDLIREYNEYEDFKIDDPVMVRNAGVVGWSKKYFAGIDYRGRPTVFAFGATSWSSPYREREEVDFCRKPTEEELEGISWMKEYECWGGSQL